MAKTSDDTTGRLTADALQLAISLDSFSTFDLAERIGGALQQGNQELKELERRQESLIVSRTDEATLGWVLEAINARLIFLESLNAEMFPTNPGTKSPRWQSEALLAEGNGG